jgi:hypothetical protein
LGEWIVSWNFVGESGQAPFIYAHEGRRLAAKVLLVHIRVVPGEAVVGTEVRLVELRGRDGATRKWEFDKPAP